MTELLVTYGGNFKPLPGKWVVEVSGAPGIDAPCGVGDTVAQALADMGPKLERWLEAQYRR